MRERDLEPTTIPDLDGLLPDDPGRCNTATPYKLAPKALGWHCLPSDRLLRDGRRAPRARHTLTGPHRPLRWCRSGFYAAARLFEALWFVAAERDPVLTRVVLGRPVLWNPDKACGSSRRILWEVRIRDLLQALGLDSAAERPAAVLRDEIRGVRRIGRRPTREARRAVSRQVQRIALELARERR